MLKFWCLVFFILQGVLYFCYNVTSFLKAIRIIEHRTNDISSLTSHPGALKPLCTVMETSRHLFPWLTLCFLKRITTASRHCWTSWTACDKLFGSLEGALHIKFGLMKQFVTALNKESAAFKYLHHFFIWGKSQSQCLRWTTEKKDPGVEGIPQEAHEIVNMLLS